MLGLPPTFWFLFAGLLVNRLGSFLFTFLTLYLTSERGLSVPRAGLIVTLYGVGAIAAGPIGGAIADRVGRRTTMLLSTSLAAATMLTFGMARAEGSIAGLALLLGLLSEMYRPAANAAVIDVVPDEARTRAFGYIYWAANLGFAGAAIIGGLVASKAFGVLFALDAGTTLLFGLIVYLRIPESHPLAGTKGPRERADLSVPYRDTRFLRFVTCQFMVAVLFFQSGIVLPLDVKANGLSYDQYGTLMAINGLLIVVLQPWAVRVVPAFRRERVMAAGTLLVGLGFGATVFAHSYWTYAATVALWTVGEIVFTPLTPVIIGDMAPTALRGSYQGVYQVAWGVASALSPVLGTTVMARLGRNELWLGCLAVAVVAAALHLSSGGYERGRSEAS